MRVSGAKAAAFVAVVAAGIGVYLGAFLLGLVETLGEESYHVTQFGISSGREGFGLGLDTMWLREGQVFFAEYEVEVTRGSFLIDVYPTFAPMDERPQLHHRVEDSGAGTVTWVVPESAVYSIYFRGSVLTAKPTRGYDVDYSVRWGARAVAE